MAGKSAADMTPTELFAQDNYGTPPAEPLYDRFRAQVAGAAGGAEDAVGKFQAWRNANPMAKWSTGPAAPFLLGPAAGRAVQIGQSGMPPQHIKVEPLPAEAPPRDITSFERNPDVPTASVSALPGAPLKPRMGPGMGPGGDIYQGVYNAQDDMLADMSALQEKKGDEYVAHLKTLNTAADMEQEVAQQQRVGARAYEGAIQAAEKEQTDSETKWQQAADETASMGVDPGRYFRNRDAGFWMTMMVGSIASGVLSAMQGRGGENKFMDYVRATAHDDIAQQDKAIDQGWRRVKGLETAYERARMRGVDKVTATQKQYDLHLMALQTDIKSRLMKAQLPEEQLRLEGALQVLQLERDQESLKIQEYRKAVVEGRARAAAAAASAQHSAERQARLDAVEMDLKRSQTTKNYAEAGKVKEGTQDKELEKDRRAFGVHTNYLTSEEVTALAKGAPGSSTSKVGVQKLPWQTDARAYSQQLDQYNAEVNTILGHWMKIEAGRVPVGEFNNIVHRYEISAGMTDAEKMARIAGLKAWVDERAKTSGVAGEVTAGKPSDLKGISSFQPAGKP